MLPQFIRMFSMIAAAWGMMAASLLAQGYKLQSGDMLQVEITRLSNARWTSMVDTNGFVRFPYIGRHFAQGKTLEELQEDIILSVVGQRVSIMSGASETVFVLDESSVFLDVAEYRPVTVVGQVGNPGNVAYRPGMTVRAAVGIAGGARQILSGTDVRPERVATLTARVAELHKSEAWLMMDLWRIKGQMDPEFVDQPPAEFADILTARIPAETLEEMPQRIAEARRDNTLELQDLQDRITLTDERISYLNRALDQYEVVSQGEEERLATLLTLQDRGLTVNTNVNNARAGALSASSRLLQTEADLSEARRDLSALNRQKNTFDLDIRQDLLAEQSRVLRSLDEVQARLQGSQKELVMLTGRPLESAQTDSFEPRILLHRKQESKMVSAPAGLDDTVLPGDVIEVSFDGAAVPQ